MQCDYQLSSVLGMLYTGGNVAFSRDGEVLHTPVGNHISQVNLHKGHTTTIACNNSDVQCFDLSADGDLMAVVGSRGVVSFYLISGRVELDTISLPPNCSVGCIRFSPCSKYIALSIESTLQIYTTPAKRSVSYQSVQRLENIHNAMTLPILCIDWSANSEILIVSGQDARIKLFPRDVRNQKYHLTAQNVLLGHRNGVVAAHFTTADCKEAVSVSADNVVIQWKMTEATRKDLMQHILETRQTAKDMYGSDSEEEDAVPESFLETQFRKKGAKRLREVQDNIDTMVDVHLPDPLKYTYDAHRRHLLQHKGRVSVAAYHEQRLLLALGYNSGMFAVHYAGSDDLTLLHVLSITAQTLTACAFNPSGDWIAFGSAHLKQLLVWDWKGESFVLKEQSHYYDISATALTNDASSVITGGDDGKVKVWKASSGQCYVTFTEHNSSVTDIAVGSTNSFFTASRDGTVRGFDLVRYRNFRVYHPPTPTQFSCVSVDPSGEVLAGGSNTRSDVILWSVQTGRVIEVYSGHEAPITSARFHPSGTCLYTGSMDKTLVVWDVFTRAEEGERLRTSGETFNMTKEVVCVSFSFAGKRVALLLLDGEVMVMDTSVPSHPEVIRSFQTQSDAAGGWVDGVGPNAKNKSNRFSKIVMSPDGETVLAAGDSRWIVLYHATQGFLLKKWAVSSNKDIEGIENQYQYKLSSEAGLVDGIDVAEDDPHLKKRKLLELPGARNKHFATGKRKTVIAARTLSLAFAPHGRDFAAATTDGLKLFSLDVARTRFNPLQLSANVTPDTVRAHLEKGNHSLAIVGSLMLQDVLLGKEAMRHTPPEQMAIVVAVVPSAAFATFVGWVAEEVQSSLFMEHALLWAKAVLLCTQEPLHGPARLPATATALKLLHRSLVVHRPLLGMTADNQHTLQFLQKTAHLPRRTVVEDDTAAAL